MQYRDGKRIGKAAYGAARIPGLLCEMTLCDFPY
jgi:hypothetical protein